MRIALARTVPDNGARASVPRRDELGASIAVDDRRGSKPRLQHLQRLQIRRQREIQRRVRRKVSGRRGSDGSDRELRVGVQSALRAERLQSRRQASSLKRAESSAELTRNARSPRCQPESGPKDRSPCSRRTVTEPLSRGAAASDHSPPSVTVETNGRLTGAELAAVAKRNAGERSARRDAAVVPRECAELDIAVGDVEAAPRPHADDRSRLRALRARRAGSAHGPRFSSASTMPAQSQSCNLRHSRLAKPAVRGGLDVEILACESQTSPCAARAFPRRSPGAGKRSLSRGESRRVELDLQRRSSERRSALPPFAPAIAAAAAARR
jgi:hypothetical protein